MAIIEIVQGNGDNAPRRLSQRIGWFIGIWALSTVALFVSASLVHLIVPK
ncbi:MULTISPECIES: DUF2474 domain-containing protein [Acetobacteraceae]|jgi:hypothetical protein|uniref:DUF2474 domain-containing protein n=4 Tax=Acetobacteraceae TaxID=433 RepID=A0A2V4R0G6_9PROT|nr:MULTISPECIES: DUF2474 domain-containing protein [Acetobacteraceae]ATU73310.1 DUF2474 domain-containing protein [Komagataeibacter xylinus]EGG77523.1 hypothetical protein SXCC_01913 [Gluconacetobacter sp. SXCC-1]ARW48996.1 hypothetical protein S1001342_02706 [Acetobacter pasteurianus subsp. pasteurianus]ATI13552.1 DUF2474 domain-containing protein [Acetobacter pomorum]AXC27852.1 DUF2474 domain-containing protein [Acetobacter sp. JWB]